MTIIQCMQFELKMNAQRSLTNKVNFTYINLEKKRGAREFEFFQKEGYVNYQSITSYVQAASKCIFAM
jgi:hypothetical protein